MFLQEWSCKFREVKSKAKKDPLTHGVIRFENKILAVLPWHVNLIFYQVSLKKQGAVAERILLQALAFSTE